MCNNISNKGKCLYKMISRYIGICCFCGHRIDFRKRNKKNNKTYKNE